MLKKKFFQVIFYFFMAAGMCQAAETAEGVASSLSMESIIVRGGFLMYVIVLLSFLAVGLIVFYLLSLRAGVLYPKSFITDAQDAAELGDIDTLRELCQENDSPAAKIINAALEQCTDTSSNFDLVYHDMEDEGVRQAGVLWQRIQYLADVGTIAPMVGLLGTVWGMMISFSGMQTGMAIVNKADALASGVSTAMFTTFGGLIVGILAIACHALFRGRINKLLSQMECACGGILRRLSLSRKMTNTTR